MFTTAFRPMIGGSEIALEEMVRHLPDIFFDIVTPRHRRAFLAKECGNNFCVYRVGFGSSELIDKLAFPCLGFLKAFRLMFKHKYTAIHAYQASYGGGAAWLVKTFVPKIKFILTLQEGKGLDKQSWGVRFFRNLIINKADAITAISGYLADFAHKVNPKAKLSVIPNGVDTEKFKPAGNPDKNTLITVSRLVTKNGVGDLIKAMKKVGDEIPDAKLIIVGDGPLRGKIELDIKNYGLKEKVVLSGKVSHGETPGYLNKASIFVRPSLSEGLGSAFLEAMASGLAVIGTPVGGIPDFLKDGETGLFCKPGDSDDIADKIIKLLKNDELRNRLADNSRRLVQEKYTWNKIAAEFGKIYNNEAI